MDNISNSWQLSSWRRRDLALPNSGMKQLLRPSAANPRSVGVDSLGARQGVQLQQRLGAEAYAMSIMTAAAKAVQGDHIAADGGVHVTDTTFPTRLGPPPLPAPV
jgi:hypothetical protein